MKKLRLPFLLAVFSFQTYAFGQSNDLQQLEQKISQTIDLLPKN